MSDKPISPLRHRMIDDMTARRFKEKVQKDYVRHVRTFAALLGRSPDTATSEELRRYQLHLAKQQISPGSINAAIGALRFFFTVTLERPDLVRPLTTVNKPRKAPVVLSEEEVTRLLEAAPRRWSSTATAAAKRVGVADFRHALWLSSLRRRDNARVALARKGRQAARTKQAIQAQNVCDKAKRGCGSTRSRRTPAAALRRKKTSMPRRRGRRACCSPSAASATSRAPGWSTARASSSRRCSPYC
jgi:hypothetical protein